MWMLVNNTLIVFLGAAALSSVDIIITRAKLFKSARDYVARKNEWLGELISCPLCMSVWLSVMLLLVTGWRLTVSNNAGIDFFVSTFFCVTIVNIFAGKIFKAYNNE